MSSENIASDQNGYASMTMSWTIALSAAIPTPSQRTPLTRAQTPKAARPCTTPMQMRTQPHVLRPLKTNFALSVKNVEFETAAMPSMKFSDASMASMTPANSTQPSPRDSSAYEYARSAGLVRGGGPPRFDGAHDIPPGESRHRRKPAILSADATPAQRGPHHLNRMIAAPFTRFG